MTVKDLLLERLPRTEGERLKPYRDTKGIWTVGVGHNIEDRGLPGYAIKELLEKGSISVETSRKVLSIDIENALRDAATIRAYITLDVFRQSVIADMVFNMGLGKVLQFVRMHNYIVAKDYASAAREMLDSKWASDVGARAKELANIMERGG